jgi:large subunit ribosomal protein L12
MLQEKIDTMEYVYAALLLHKLGKDVDEANLSSVVKASGAEVNEAQVKSLVAALADVNIDDAVKAAPVAVAAAAPAADAPAAGGEAKEEKKEEPKNEEAAMEGLSSLFG